MVALLQKFTDEFKLVLPISSPVSNIPTKSAYISPSELPKFSESISSDDAFRYLSTKGFRNLSDDDRLIVQAFKFFSFRA